MADEPLLRLRSICFGFPATEERLSHGEPTWFAGGKKVFATYANYHHVDRLAFWCPAAPGVQDLLIRSTPERYFVPPYVGHRGWLGVYLDVEVDWDQVEELVAAAWRLVAPRRLTGRRGPRG